MHPLAPRKYQLGNLWHDWFVELMELLFYQVSRKVLISSAFVISLFREDNPASVINFSPLLKPVGAGDFALHSLTEAEYIVRNGFLERLFMRLVALSLPTSSLEIFTSIRSRSRLVFKDY
jgi:hypothetical protein